MSVWMMEMQWTFQRWETEWGDAHLAVCQSSGEISGAFRSNLIATEVECSDCLCGWWRCSEPSKGERQSGMMLTLLFFRAVARSRAPSGPIWLPPRSSVVSVCVDDGDAVNLPKVRGRVGWCSPCCSSEQWRDLGRLQVLSDCYRGWV